MSRIPDSGFSSIDFLTAQDSHAQNIPCSDIAYAKYQWGSEPLFPAISGGRQWGGWASKAKSSEEIANAWRQSTDVNRSSTCFISTLFGCSITKARLQNPRRDVMVKLPSLPYGPSKEGFWSPVTSTINWCEEVREFTVMRQQSSENAQL
jgi:hypothetical protein